MSVGLLQAERGGEWRFFGRFVAGYGALSLMCLALARLDPRQTWIEPLGILALPILLLMGPLAVLFETRFPVQVFAIETVVIFGLVLWCTFLYSRAPAHFMALACVTGAIWIAGVLQLMVLAI